MNNKYSKIRINGERLLDRLTEMAQIGSTPKGGVCRVALQMKTKQAAIYLSNGARVRTAPSV